MPLLTTLTWEVHEICTETSGSMWLVKNKTNSSLVFMILLKQVIHLYSLDIDFNGFRSGGGVTFDVILEEHVHTCSYILGACWPNGSCFCCRAPGSYVGCNVFNLHRTRDPIDRRYRCVHQQLNLVTQESRKECNLGRHRSRAKGSRSITMPSRII